MPLIPTECRTELGRRLMVVWAFALLIGLAHWLTSGEAGERGSLATALVYSYAIATAIWAWIDPLRLVLWRWLGARPPDYWPSSRLGGAAWVACAVVAGYGLGSAVGDWYGGGSTWARWTQNPTRFWAVAVTSAAITLGFTAYFVQHARAQSLARLASENRLRLLQSQLDPHMVFNTLANLRALIVLDQTRALAMVDAFSAWLRSTLSVSSRPTHSLAQEMVQLEHYLALMHMRMGERLAYSVHWPDVLARLEVPTLLLQPLVENAIKHGLDPLPQGGRVEITATATNGRCVMCVVDNGAGWPAIHQEGFGLGLVRERLQAQWGARARLDLRPARNGGTEATVTLPWDNPQAS
jgi:hypothetical protein